MGKKSKQKASYKDNNKSKAMSNSKNKKGDKDTGRMIKIELDQSEETLLADIISAIEIDDYTNNHTIKTNTYNTIANDEEIVLYDTIMPEDEKHHKTISKKKRYTDMTIHDKERFIKRLIRDDRYKRKQAEIDKKLDRYDKYIANKQTDEVIAINDDEAHTYNTTVVDATEENSLDYSGQDNDSDDDDSSSCDDDNDSNDDDDEEEANRNDKPSPGPIFYQCYLFIFLFPPYILIVYSAYIILEASYTTSRSPK